MPTITEFNAWSKEEKQHFFSECILKKDPSYIPLLLSILAIADIEYTEQIAAILGIFKFKARNQLQSFISDKENSTVKRILLLHVLMSDICRENFEFITDLYLKEQNFYLTPVLFFYINSNYIITVVILAKSLSNLEYDQAWVEETLYKIGIQQVANAYRKHLGLPNKEKLKEIFGEDFIQ